MMRPERLSKLVLIAVLPISAAVFLPALDYGLVRTDADQIVRMQPRYTWHDIPGYFTTDVWSYITVAKTNYYRPIFLVWLMLNSKLFGSDAGLWHASAIALHLLAVALLYFLARRLTGSTVVAGVTALLFGVHPVHVEAVAWISGATEPLFATLALGALLCCMRARDASTPEASRTRWRIAAVGLFTLCIFSKETAIVLPVLIAAYELLFPAEAGSKKRWRSAFATVFPMAVVSLFYLAARELALGTFEPLVRHWTPRMLVGTLPGVLLFYVRQLLLPWRYSIFYPIEPVVAFHSSAFWAPLLAVILVAAILLWISLRSRLAAFCSILMVLPILPVLNLSAFLYDDFEHDRYAYLSSAGLCILAAVGIERALGNHPARRAIAVASLVVFLCAVNLKESRFWADEVSLYIHAYERAPDSHSAQVDLGYALVQARRFTEARPLLAEALAADPQDYNLYLNLGDCANAVGDWDEAAGYFNDAIQFHPKTSAAYVHLAGVEVQQHRLAEAEGHMRQGLERREMLTADTRTYHYLLGTILEQEGKLADALAEYEADLQEEPDSSNAYEGAARVRRAH